MVRRIKVRSGPTPRKIIPPSSAAPAPGADADAIHDNVAGEIDAITEATPVSGDWLLFEDTSDSDGKKKANASNFLGGGGGTTWLDPVPSGNAPSGGSDDEFDDDSLTGWTQVDAASSATVTWTEARDVLSIFSPGEAAGHRWHAQVKTIPGGASTVMLETAIRIACFNPATGDFPTVGHVFSDGVTPGAGKQLLWYFHLRATALGLGAQGFIGAINTTNWNTFGSAPVNNDLNIQSPWLFLRIEWQGSNNWAVWYSPDGVSWDLVSSFSFTMTPSHMGVISTNNGAGGADYVATWEYFRVTNT